MWNFNSAFRKYVSENGLSPYENAGIVAPVLQGYGTAGDIVSGALGATSNVSKGLFGSISSLFGGNGFKNTISIALIAGGVYGITYVYKTFKK